jgi:hypothetical protein
MDRLPHGATLAALFLSTLALTACGGQTSSAAVPAPPPPAAQAVTGVSTPSSVSVVTAKNAE